MEYWVCWCVLEDDMLFDLQLLMKKNKHSVSIHPVSKHVYQAPQFFLLTMSSGLKMHMQHDQTESG